MDAAAYLKSHGWRGLGYPLDKADRGISRPLLISHKNDALGVGKKKTLVADQWWMRAFDEGLKNIGTGKESTLSQIQTGGIKKNGLYGFFVRGESLAGSISDTPSSTPNREPTTVTAATIEVISEETTNEDSTSEETTSEESATEEITTEESASEDAEMDSVPPLMNAKADARQEEVRADETQKKRKRSVTDQEDAHTSKRHAKDAPTARDALHAERQQMLDPTSARNDELVRRKLAMINRRAMAHADRLMKQGQFGPQLPHPTAMQQMGIKHIHGEHFRKTQSTSEGDTGTDEQGSSVPSKLTRKKAKYIQQKMYRDAKRAERERLMALELPEELSRERAKKDRKNKAKKDTGDDDDEGEVSKQEKPTKSPSKLARKQLRAAQRRGEVPDSQQEKPNARASNGAGESKVNTVNSVDDAFAGGNEIIRLSGQSKVRKGASEDPTRKYASNAEKRARKLAGNLARASGTSLDEVKAMVEKERAEMEAARQARVGRTGSDTTPLLSGGPVTDPGPQTVDSVVGRSRQPSDLPAKKRERYAARAAEKGVSLEEYLAQRDAKKAAKDDAAEDPAPAPAFFIDTEGDVNILKNQQKGSDLIDGKAAEGGDDPDLVKARKKLGKKHARSPAGSSKKEREAQRMANKMKRRNRLVSQILQEKGFSKGEGEGPSKSELLQSRREAKRIMRIEKKAKKGGRRAEAM